MSDFSPALLAALDAIPDAPAGLTLNQVFDDPALGKVKIRTYDTETAAARMEALLARLDGAIHLPHLYGRRGRHLIFRYLSLDTEPDLDGIYFGIGETLGRLNQLPAESTSPSSLADEFAGWMRRFSRMGLLPAKITAQALEVYRRTVPQDAVICLDYWDAMPHNFGWSDGVVYMLDEKHLRPGFFGVGLVKPYFLLPPDGWAQVCRGYAGAASLREFERTQPFLEFYYLAAALYFYSLAIAAGRISPIRNPRYLDYRDRFIRRVSDSAFWGLAIGDFQLLTNFPQAAPMIFGRRLRSMGFSDAK